MDNNDKVLNEVVDVVLAKFNYLDLDRIQVLKIIKQYSVDIKDENIDSFRDKLIKQVNEYYNLFVYQSIINKDYTYIDNYISKRIMIKKNLNGNVSSIMMFVHFLEEINISIDNVELFKYLFSKNQYIKICLSKVLDGNSINRSSLEKLSSDGSVISFLEFYCNYNGIAILDDNDFDKIIIEYNKNNELDLTDNIVKDFLRKIGKIPLFTYEQEKRYLYEYSVSKDSEIKNKIVEANLRLVVMIAKRYIGRGVSFMDLIHEGCIGMMKAIDKFDINKDVRFSTYASWWIRQAMGSAVAYCGRTVRLPLNRVESLNVYKRQKEEYFLLFGREPLIYDMVEFTGRTLREVMLFEKILVPSISTSMPIGDDDENILEDFIVDDGLTTEEKIIEDDLKKKIRFILDSLPEREARILSYRFGFYDGIPYTLEQIGKIENITRERVRQIEQKALKRLRNPAKTKILRDFY